jgi:hypothetical protein
LCSSPDHDALPKFDPPQRLCAARVNVLTAARLFPGLESEPTPSEPLRAVLMRIIDLPRQPTGVCPKPAPANVTLVTHAAARAGIRGDRKPGRARELPELDKTQ